MVMGCILTGATKKPPGGRLNEHVGGPRALRNDDDGEVVGGGCAAHHPPFNPARPRSSNVTRSSSARFAAPLGTKLCTTLCTAGGRRTNSWGLTRSSGDNPGDSEIPLDLVFLVRESNSRTGQRTPTGAGKPGRAHEHLRVIRVRSRVRSTRRRRVRTERETTRSGYRVAGQPGATGTGLPGRGRGGTPTAPDVEVRRRHHPMARVTGSA